MQSYIILVYILLLQMPLEILAQDTLNAAIFFDQIPQFKIGKGVKSEINLPLIDNYEFRTRSNEFELNRQQYTIRLTPSTIKRRRAQKAIHEHLVNRPNFNQQEYEQDLIKSLNEDWLKILYLKSRIELLDSLQTNRQLKSKILNEESHSLTYKEGRLIKVAIEHTDLRVEYYKHQNLLKRLLKKYSALDTQEFFSDLLSISEVLQDLSGELTSNSSFLLTKDQYKSDYIQKEIELEQADRGQLFDFLQLRYEGSDEDPLREQLSVGVAFKLNRTSQSKLKIEELRLEQQETQAEMRWDKQELKYRLEIMRDDLIAEIRFLEFYSSSISEERVQLKSVQNNILMSSDFDPLLIIEIQERDLINRLELLDLRYNIYSDYIDFSARAGTKWAMDKMNWLGK